ncbi:hypothetical protein VTK73DRAFT_5426 [Phialemonium thermophilum]|uniref:Uncharacterized protein n=1 Tax=Phialemonium thermophilum TaxID=223376 RepID=A0ABR3V2B0_9PEZI
MAQLIDVPHALRHLTLDEKIRLLAGKDTWSTHEIKRLNIPSITPCPYPYQATRPSLLTNIADIGRAARRARNGLFQRAERMPPPVRHRHGSDV